MKDKLFDIILDENIPNDKTVIMQDNKIFAVINIPKD
jgi:hypothetical protein